MFTGCRVEPEAEVRWKVEDKEGSQAVRGGLKHRCRLSLCAALPREAGSPVSGPTPHFSLHQARSAAG